MPVPDPRLARLRADLAASSRLYVGMGASGPGLTAPQQAALVLGPPRSGKTTGLVVPNVLAAPGAVVSTSTKTDVLAATLDVRAALGRVWLLDPTGTVPLPDGVTPVRWSPVDAAGAWDDALVVARAMVGASRPGGHRGEAAHWSERAEALLAPLLHAAHLSGVGMRAVVGWVLRQDAGAPRAILAGEEATMGVDVLSGLMATDPREQSGIWSTAAGVLAAYRSEAALEASNGANFDPAALAAGTDTVYVCAPARHQQLVAPIIVAFLEAVRAGAYACAEAACRRGGTPGPALVAALDEVANIAPLPDLPAMVSEAGGQGLLTLACVLETPLRRRASGADGTVTGHGAQSRHDTRWRRLDPVLAGTRQRPK